MKTSNVTLSDLGYDDFFEAVRKELGLVENSLARVIAEYKEAYRVKSVDSEYLAKITGKQMFMATIREDYPAVGDWVVIDELPDEKAVIRKILPRKTILKKQYSDKQDTQIIATNIDFAFIVESLDRDYNLNRFERFLVLVNEGRIKPIIVLNKTDLIPKKELDSRISQIINRFSDIEIITSSIVKEQGLKDISNHIIKGKTYCFLGSSGVGKSSLINKLLGKDEIKTREINLDIERGRHTTTTRDMYFLGNGGIVIDNPGTREVGIADSDTGIENIFDEISFLSRRCRFSDCAHLHEPGCAVLKAVEQKELDKGKYDNYIKLKKESEFYKMNEVEKRAKDRKFGQFVKKYYDMFKDD
ncbi:ribosome small subunit-dependent GTPase A [Candidatus Gottesmanbacteria bacterium RBG_13_37_7]|uniref:Small ribosomal subunit biogenesis GTPase RsgA n=1 Tax=Candidatus Gottesmanbacteria bacterium RBG_13_37_7 TaxID=1798369 RepID=A0A1F5YKA3_9BACT|nr:MAG: ribosome small subunit-dependent GTPase A [Candidatus Gottesmanbacteria bacterium RBG_13_37_7]